MRSPAQVFLKAVHSPWTNRPIMELRLYDLKDLGQINKEELKAALASLGEYLTNLAGKDCKTLVGALNSASGGEYDFNHETVFVKIFSNWDNRPEKEEVGEFLQALFNL